MMAAAVAIIFFAIGIQVARRYLVHDPLGSAIKHLGDLSEQLKGLQGERVVTKSYPLPSELLERKRSIEAYRQTLKDKQLELQKLDDADTMSTKQWWRDVEKELNLSGDPDLRYNEETNSIEVLGAYVDKEKK